MNAERTYTRMHGGIYTAILLSYDSDHDMSLPPQCTQSNMTTLMDRMVVHVTFPHEKEYCMTAGYTMTELEQGRLVHVCHQVTLWHV
jgi:hypothetical protein